MPSITLVIVNAAAPSLSSDPARPLAIEDPTNRWLVHRLSDALLVPAIRVNLHPNTVSLMGLVFGAAAGWAYADWRDPRFATLGLMLMLGWHVCDGLDGRLARATGRASPLGRLLDGLCDYAVFFCVLLPIAFSLPDRPLMVALCVSAGAAHALQSAYFEGERTSWIRRSRGEMTAQDRSTAGGVFETFYNASERLLANRTRPIDLELRKRPQALPLYLEATAPLVRRLAVLSANSRTIAIWLACMAGHPAWFWWWELFGLTVFALALARALRRTEAQLVTTLSRTDGGC